MHRRMSLGLGLLFVLMFLAGSASALPEPPATEANAAGSFNLLDWVWEWIGPLVNDGGTSSSGGGHLSESEGGVFIDPLGSSNS